MAGRKQKQVATGALDFMSGFLISEAKKPPKRRPPKYSGIDVNDPTAQAFAQIAAAPYAYINNAVSNAFNETYGKSFDIFRVSLDKTVGDAAEVRVRPKDIPAITKDPIKYVNEIYQKIEAEQNWGAWTGFVGGTMERALAAAWAKKNGMKGQDVTNIYNSAADTLDVSMEEDALNMSLETKAVNAARAGKFGKDEAKAVQAAKDLRKAIGKNLTGSVFGDVDSYKSKIVQSLSSKEQQLYKAARGGQGIADLSEKDRVSFLNLEGRVNNQVAQEMGKMAKLIDDQKTEIRNKLSGKYTPAEVDDLIKGYEEYTQEALNYQGADGRLSPLGLRQFHQRQLIAKAALAHENGQTEARDQYLRAASVVDVLNRTKGSFGDGGYKSVNKMAESVAKQLADARAIASPTAADKAYISELEGIYANLQSEVKKYNIKAGAYIAKDASWRDTHTGKHDYIEDSRNVSRIVKFKIESDIARLENKLANGGTLNLDDMLKLEQLRHSRNQVGYVRGQNLRRMYGQYQLLKAASTSGILQGGIVSGLFSGALFNPDDPFSPAVVKGVKVKYMNQKGKIENREYGGIMLPRDDYWKVAPGFANLAHLYYFTPGSLVKSFTYNGEIFKYNAELNRRSLIQTFFKHVDAAQFNSIISANSDLQALFPSGFDLKDPSSLRTFADNYLEVLTKLEGTPLNNLYKRLMRKQKWMNRTLDAAEYFSIPQKFIDKYIKGALFNSALGAAYKNVLEKGLFALSKNPVWRSQVLGFLSNQVGVMQLIETAVSLALKAIGFTLGGPIGSFVTMIVSGAVVKTLYKVSKPFLELGASAFSGFLMIVAALLILCGSSFNSLSLMQPHKVQPPIGGVGLPPLDPSLGGDTGNGDPDADPPTDAMCPINVGASCPQGPHGGFSHAKMKTLAIDVGLSAGTWRAPTDGRVTTATPTLRCKCSWCPRSDWDKSIGGNVIFVDSQGAKYRILHSVPLVGTGAVKKGTPIAAIATGLPRSACWTGAHFHLEVSAGGYVNSEDWYNKLQCGINC